MKRKLLIPAIIAIVVISAVFCSACVYTREPSGAVGAETIPAAPGHHSDWRTIPLTDISTGSNFSIEEFRDVPVLIQTFTVWCPICISQQQQVMQLRDAGVDFRFVALDIDPNEDETLVRDHLTRNNFSGYYAVAPLEATASLLNEFGVGIVTPSSAPVILVCPGGSVTFLHAGVKDAEHLELALSGC